MDIELLLDDLWSGSVFVDHEQGVPQNRKLLSAIFRTKVTTFIVQRRFMTPLIFREDDEVFCDISIGDIVCEELGHFASKGTFFVFESASTLGNNPISPCETVDKIVNLTSSFINRRSRYKTRSEAPNMSHTQETAPTFKHRVSLRAV